MVSSKTMLNYSDWKIPFTVHSNASDKTFGSDISQNNKTISFFSIILINIQHDYNMTDNELLSIVE